MNDDILAPIDFLAIEFPDGEVAGSSFGVLRNLVQSEVVRIVDLEVISKSADGSVTKATLEEVPHAREIDTRTWDGASTGILDEEDIEAVAAAIQPGSVGLILVYENTWASPLYDDVAQSKARIVGSGRIQVDDLMTALEHTAQA